MARLYHIAGSAEWGAGDGDYEPDAYERDGFVHLSSLDQVLTPANLWYRDRTDLVLLVIDEEALRSPVVREPGTGTDEIFPHLYDTVNRDAVVDVVAFPCDPDGGFSTLPVS